MFNEIINALKNKSFYDDLTNMSYFSSNIKHEGNFIYCLSKNIQSIAKLGYYFLEVQDAHGKKRDLTEVSVPNNFAKNNISKSLEAKFHLECDAIPIAKNILYGSSTNTKGFKTFTDFADWWEKHSFKNHNGKNPTSIVAPMIIKDMYSDPTCFLWILHHRPVHYKDRVCFSKQLGEFSNAIFYKRYKRFSRYQGDKVHTHSKNFIEIADLFASHAAKRYGYKLLRSDINTLFTSCSPYYKSDYHVYLFTKESGIDIEKIVKEQKKDNKNVERMTITAELMQQDHNLWIYK